jgi:hypothetical protein
MGVFFLTLSSLSRQRYTVFNVRLFSSKFFTLKFIIVFFCVTHVLCGLCVKTICHYI